jgi:hypothetical protein
MNPTRRDTRIPEAWGYKINRAINAMTGARSMFVTPLISLFYSTTLPPMVLNASKVTILIWGFSKLNAIK